MSNNEHTPGPWKALTRDPLFTKRNRFDILLTADEDMSSQSWASVMGPNSEADARLIAAAPELLAALKRTLSMAIGHAADARGVSPAECGNFQWVKDAQGAINRATEGEET
jgi:hypothetical protein